MGEGLNPVILWGLPVAKAPIWNGSDGEGRKRGKRSGLDTGLSARVLRCFSICRPYYTSYDVPYGRQYGKMGD